MVDIVRRQFKSGKNKGKSYYVKKEADGKFKRVSNEYAKQHYRSPKKSLVKKSPAKKSLAKKSPAKKSPEKKSLKVGQTRVKMVQCTGGMRRQKQVVKMVNGKRQWRKQK